MDELTHLPAVMREQLLRVLESSLSVRHRGEFFLWAQGQLQAVLPHGVMVGMVFDSAAKVSHCECLQAVPMDAALLASLQDPEAGLLSAIGRYCHAKGRTALTLPLTGVDMQTDDDLCTLDEQWQLHRLGSAQFMSTGDLGVGEFAFFALLLQPDAASETRELLLRVLMPQLLVLLWRSRQYARKETLTNQGAGLLGLGLTERQLEILHWVKLGKTNNEIAQIVDISELTVKNHLQKTFKRMNVHNRAQAVATLMSLGKD